MKITKATGRLLSPQQQREIPFKESFLLEKALPAQGGEVKGVDLEDWLRDILKPVLSRPDCVYFGDVRYYLPTEADIAQVWNGSGLANLAYKTERFDCDDFAFAFKGECGRYAYFRQDWLRNGICVGFVSGDFGWSGGNHAANLFVDSIKGVAEVKFIEPSSGVIYPQDQCTAINTLFI